jgi:hypothetical protein
MSNPGGRRSELEWAVTGDKSAGDGYVMEGGGDGWMKLLSGVDGRVEMHMSMDGVTDCECTALVRIE